MFTNTKFKNFYIAVLLSVTLALSIFAEPSLFSIYINNVIPVRIALPILVLVGYILFLKKIKIKKKSYLDFALIFLFLFNLVNFLTIFVTVDVKNYLGINIFWFLLFLYLLLLKNVNLSYAKTIFFKFLLGISILMVFLSAVSFIYFLYIFLFNGYWGPIKVSTVISDENHYAFYVLFLIFTNLYLLNTKTLRVKSYIYYLILFFLSSIFLGLQSRSAMLGLLFGGIVYVFFSILKKLLIIKPIIVILLGLFFSTWFFKPFVTTASPKYANTPITKKQESANLKLNEDQKNFDTIVNIEKLNNNLPHSLNEASVKSHISLLFISYFAGINNPLLGVGVGSFNEYVMANKNLFNLYAKYDPQAAYSGVFPAHSMYGQNLAESGFFGFTFYILFLFSIFIFLLNKINNTKDEVSFRLVLCSLSIFVGYLVFTITYNLHEEWFWIPFFTLLVLVDQQSNKNQKSLN